MHRAVLFQTASWLEQGREAGTVRTAGRRRGALRPSSTAVLQKIKSEGSAGLPRRAEVALCTPEVSKQCLSYYRKLFFISKSKLLSWITHLGQTQALQARSAGDASVWNISRAHIIRHFFPSEKKFTSDRGSSRNSIHLRCSEGTHLTPYHCATQQPCAHPGRVPPPALQPSQRTLLCTSSKTTPSAKSYSPPVD